MNVTAAARQSSVGTTYGSYSSNINRGSSSAEMKEESTLSADFDFLETSADETAGLNSSSDNSNYKMKSSGPKNSVGELASLLARAETTLDVQQVLSKAMRALADLKMGALASEGKDAKKYAQQIKRMEKLIKRIQQKLKHLGKEQRMEDQRKKASKNNEEEKAKQIEKELHSRRKKRRREEQRYAMREMAEDRKSQTDELTSSVMDSLGASSSSDFSSLTDMGDFSVDFASMEGISIDISV